MADGHHLAFSAGGRDVELFRDRRRRERVVAAGDEVIGQVAEEAEAIVADNAGLAVDERLRQADLAPEDFDDRLVAEADTEGRHGRRKSPDDLARGAGISRTSG